MAGSTGHTFRMVEWFRLSVNSGINWLEVVPCGALMADGTLLLQCAMVRTSMSTFFNLMCSFIICYQMLA